MKKVLLLITIALLCHSLTAQNVKIGPNNNNAEIYMTPNRPFGSNVISMLNTNDFGRSQWRLIYDKNNLTPPQGPIEFAWEVGLGNVGVPEDFFSIGRYDFNLDFIFSRPALVIDNQSLFTGIGEAEPDARLHVYNLDNLNDNSNEPAAVIGEYPGAIFGYGYLTVDQPDNDLSANIARFRNNGATQVSINRGSSTYQLQVFGDAFASGNWQTSDRRLKTQLRPMEAGLKGLRQLKPYTYNYKRDQEQLRYLPEELQFGLVAQELQEVYPNLVRESEQRSEEAGAAEKILAVNYTGLIPVLIGAVQELDEELTSKNRELENLQRENADQQRQIDELRNMMERLLAERTDEGTGGSSYTLPLQQKASLSQNFPNPFDRNTVIKYVVPAGARDARIQVTAMDGKVLGTVDILESGEGQLTIEAGTYPAGTYLYSLLVDGRVVETKRMVLTR